MENDSIKACFFQLASGYSKDQTLISGLWNEIRSAYEAKGRYYHKLAHLEHLYRQLQEIKPLINDWNTVLFSLYYHDIVYDATKGDNEEQSAVIAEKRMKTLGISESEIESCRQQILATKSHAVAVENDTNLFTDADLSILGSPWDTYHLYARNVRNEYKVYPDFLYNPGRKKVLNHFLEMDRIFKTEVFFEKFELQARGNLQKEAESL